MTEPRRCTGSWTLLALMLGAGACGKDEAPPAGDSAAGVDDSREPCAVQVAERQLLWGDLHVHTALSFDAWVYDVRLGPDEATRFARGEEVRLPPLDEAGGTVPLQLDRPLDFVAITDHADLMGEVQGCTEPGTAAYESDFCAGYRQAEQTSIQAIATILASDEPVRHEEICGDPADFDCEAAAREAWGLTREVAEAHYDRTAACEFTTFVAYEWTGATGISNFHRNVIFGSATVPEAPVTYFDEATPQGLWAALQRECLEVDGCDVLAIPHNSDMSNGQQFEPVYPGASGEAEEAEAAELRVAMEPLLEIYQHKGDAECFPTSLGGVLGATDERCTFEKQRDPDDATDCGDEPGAGGMAGFGCVSRNDYLRGILLTGLAEEERLGVNPYELGVTASTDTHSGTPGYVSEDAWLGHLGGFEDDPEERLSRPGLTPGGYTNSAGGLVGAWSVSNDREALFEAFRRREVYGTSGPRLAVRFFGGAELDSGLCGDPELVARADAAGVPMGGRLARSAGAAAPTFLVHALMDAEEGVPLERVQIVKGWREADGSEHVRVIDVAGGEHEASVDPETCAPLGEGHAELCETWTDDDWDPAERAWYYARVLQNPTCRWSSYDCLSYDEAERPEVCDDGTLAATVQERAWTSPIFY